MNKEDSIVNELKEITAQCTSDIFGLDQECEHVEYDRVLVDFVRSLGYNKIADQYESTDKWFA